MTIMLLKKNALSVMAIIYRHRANLTVKTHCYGVMTVGGILRIVMAKYICILAIMFLIVKYVEKKEHLQKAMEFYASGKIIF